MAAIQQTIPNLLGGVSQQPDDIKLPGQVRKAENILLDPTFGCMKRPPTQWITAMATDIPEDAQWFPIFRDNQELYMAVIYRATTGDMLTRVWDVQAGDEITVNISAEWQDYTETTTADKIRYLTIADHTLLANTEVSPTVSKVEPDVVNDVLVTVDSVSYNTTYSIDLSNPGDDPVIVSSATEVSNNRSTWEDTDDPDEVGQYANAETFTIDWDMVFESSSNENGVIWARDKDGVAKTEGSGLVFRINTQVSVYRDYDTDDKSISRYVTDTILYNGGEGWYDGDQVYVKMNDKSYTITIKDTSEIEVYAAVGTASVTSPIDSTSGGLSVSDITSQLVTAVGEIGNYQAETVNNVIRIYKGNNAEFVASARGGASGSAMTVIAKTATDISVLPTQCFHDYNLKIVNTEDSTADDYYVRFESDQSDLPGPGAWIETVAEGQKEFLNENSMPFALTREADRTFTLAPLSRDSALGGWAPREVGDEDTNPTPSFVGNTIRGMFLHRNRLGFITEGACVLSQPGDYFNFYTVSGAAVSDADPIDISASDTKPVSLKEGVSTTSGVVLLGEQAQFSLGTEEAIFSANTAEMKKISGYDYFGNVLPQHTGVSIMYATSAGEFTKVMELSVESIKNSPVTSETTRAVPRYIPTDIDWSASSPNNDLVLLGKRGDGVYCFRFFNEGNERKLAGWFKWTFAGDIQFGAFKGDNLYLVQRMDTQYQLLRLTLVDGPNSPINVDFTQFRPRIDMQISSDNLVSGDTVTQPNGSVLRTWNLPIGFVYDGEATIAYTDVRTGEFEQTPITNNTFQVEDSREFYVGVEYNGTVTLPRFWVSPDPNKQRADHVSPPMVQYIYLDLFNSGAIKANLQVRGYPTQDFFLEVTQADDYAADAVVVEENITYDLPVFQRGDYINLTLNSTTPFPTSITSYSWQGQYNKRGYRYM